MRLTADPPAASAPAGHGPRLRLRREVLKATAAGLVVTLLLTLLIVIGSRNLAYFDAALIGYTFGTLFAVFGLTYRYAMWLQRPPTSLYWRRGWQTFLDQRYLAVNLRNWVVRMVADIGLNRFIFRRGALRGFAHALIFWGCVIAALITFPLVFGWLHFQSSPGDLEQYVVVVFGFPSLTFPVHSFLAFSVFHGLVWSAFLTMAGVMLAMRRRMRDEGAAAVQRYGEDILPLVMLFAVSLTGLLLTASYTWMKGYAYDFLALLHAVTVILTLLWLPFGKFFHIFQRPAQLGVSFYKDAGRKTEAAHCRRCGQPFTSRMHVEDLIQVERALGYRYETGEAEVAHYQWICPPCRRALVAVAQGQLWQMARGQPADGRKPTGPAPTPYYVNPATGEGPLGPEDASNFHP